MRWLIQLGCFCLAAFAASLAFVLAMVFVAVPPLDADDVLTATVAFTFVAILLGGVPAVGFIALATHKGWRTWPVYLGFGAGIGLLLTLTTGLTNLSAVIESRVILAGPLAGAAGGLAYWALYGWTTPSPGQGR